MISLKNDRGRVVQVKEGFSFGFLMFGPFMWLLKGHPLKFFKSAIKCVFIIPWISGFMGGFNRELLEYYVQRGYQRI